MRAAAVLGRLNVLPQSVQALVPQVAAFAGRMRQALPAVPGQVWTPQPAPRKPAPAGI